MSTDNQPGPRRPFIAGNGTDEMMLIAFCEGCRHFGVGGNGCEIWFKLDLGQSQDALTVADIYNSDIRCTKREQANEELVEISP